MFFNSARGHVGMFLLHISIGSVFGLEIFPSIGGNEHNVYCEKPKIGVAPLWAVSYGRILHDSFQFALFKMNALYRKVVLAPQVPSEYHNKKCRE